MRPAKFLIVIILLLSSIVLSFTLPKARYIGTNFISTLEIPFILKGWQGKDVSSKLNINYKDDLYNFLAEAAAYEYVNKYGENLLFIIINAANFHYPNVCFTASGYKIRELKKTEFLIPGHSFKAYTLLTEKSAESYLVIYWIVIDKKIVSEWVEQKVKQLYFSLFNKKRVGLMVRLDIPVKTDNIENGLTLAKQFITDLSQTLPPEQVDYIFGEK